MAQAPVIVVGAGIGGLAAAVVLAARGQAVRVIERDSAIGGKLRPVHIGGHALDAGPTVMTMRPVFDQLFELAGERLDTHLQLTPLRTLARHAWPDGSRFDLHAERAATVDALGRFAGAQAARQYAVFCERSKAVFQTLDGPYLRSSRPSPLSLTWRCARAGWPQLRGLMGISPFNTLWRELGRQFDDARLRQLFARYATYGGSSPLAAPATLMLIAHVEQAGVWSVQGGMHRLAEALAGLARQLGVSISCGQGVARVITAGGRVSGVRLTAPDGGLGDALPASAVVFNGDAAALPAGLLGDAVQGAVPARPVAHRSLSALTWNLRAPARGFPLLRHTVFFSGDYPREFHELFNQGRLPTEPTVYVCAQDRGDEAAPDDGAPERLLCLVNAPARGDQGHPTDEEIAACEQRTFLHLARLGLQVQPDAPGRLRHGPAQWAQRFPATGGALYGPATHGWRASFSRPAASTAVPGLYLAGGSTHPGAGVPMAALSGMLAAQQLLADHPGRTSTWPWRPAVMPGGTSTR
ncbi:MAG: phytoene desaturase family protein [Aquabacterium sp.]|nr:phytoene desaturase family protein [Aquabacterium sp.]